MMKKELTQGFEESTRLKLLIVMLSQMGFKDDTVERTIIYAKAKSIEECLPYLVLNEKNLTEHKFVPYSTFK